MTYLPLELSPPKSIMLLSLDLAIYVIEKIEIKSHSINCVF